MQAAYSSSLGSLGDPFFISISQNSSRLLASAPGFLMLWTEQESISQARPGLRSVSKA